MAFRQENILSQKARTKAGLIAEARPIMVRRALPVWKVAEAQRGFLRLLQELREQQLRE
jgi:hypothetical protein